MFQDIVRLAEVNSDCSLNAAKWYKETHLLAAELDAISTVKEGRNDNTGGFYFQWPNLFLAVIGKLFIPGCTTALWHIVFVMSVCIHSYVWCSDTQMARHRRSSNSCCCCCCCVCTAVGDVMTALWDYQDIERYDCSTLTHRKDTMWHSHSVQSALCRIVSTEREANTRPHFKAFM